MLSRNNLQTKYIYIYIYIYKQNLALNNPEMIMCHYVPPNEQTTLTAIEYNFW